MGGEQAREVEGNAVKYEYDAVLSERFAGCRWIECICICTSAVIVVGGRKQ